MQNNCLYIDEELYSKNGSELREEKYLGAYSSFEGSPLSNGQFQFDMWEQSPLENVPGIDFNWDNLREEIILME